MIMEITLYESTYIKALFNCAIPVQFQTDIKNALNVKFREEQGKNGLKYPFFCR